MTKIICGIDDVALIPTPNFSVWGCNGREDRIEERPMAKLHTSSMPPRKVTLVLSNAYGDPFVETGNS